MSDATQAALVKESTAEVSTSNEDPNVTPSNTSGANTPDPNSKSAAKKKAKQLEKEAKLAAKALKQAAGANSAPKKVKAEKKKEEAEPEFVNDTPAGQKKDLSNPMAAGYNPIAVEASWYDWWVAEGFFKPKVGADGNPETETFVIPSPPPNVTGSLHIGHGLTVAIQDSLVRWNRMRGKSTLFVPGFDHAGISTQSVVEKRLWKNEGKTRRDLGREKFLGTVMDWKNEYQERITKQLHRLGGSYDWDRAVIETFCRLREDGIIYRANRLVNWCVKLNTTLSNLEVDQKQLTGRTLLNVPGYDAKERFEFGVITSFGYQIEGSDEKVVIATTRPETMLGDTAIAVHPDDPRYTHLHGKFAVHPFVDRRIPIIQDSIIVDMEFGTGAVKITPAHDPNDYEVGTRHKLDFINILNDDGTLNANAGEKFKGMKRFHARNEVVKQLKELGLFVETKDNPMQIPICSKSGDVIEPILKPQWWVNCKPLADKALEHTRKGEILIQPKQSENEWYRWLENIQDWCVSRQLWWGHRVPAYFVNIEGEEQEADDDKFWVVGLWPFSIMGWPDKTPDFKNFYPSSLLETGWDILFFWVARMVMLGVHLTGEVPFKEIYCHAMIRDAHGRKMSKSLGNVIDPIDVIQGLPLEELHKKLYEGNLDEKEIKKAEAGQKKDFPKGIPQCGTDALRFALCAYSGGGRDINLEILRVEGYRKFCNKIFNATKFAMLKLDETFVPEPLAKPTGNEGLVEKWIFHKLNIAATELNQALEERNFMTATNIAYNFWLYELCDVYIEAMKPMTDGSAPESVKKSAQQTLYTCLDAGLKLLHPFMPFVTEELWQRLRRRPRRLHAFNRRSFEFAEAEKQFDLVFSALKTGRSLAASYNLQSEIQFFIQVQNDADAALFEQAVPTIVTLTKGGKSAKVVRNISEVPEGCGSAVVTASIVVHTLVKGLVDLDSKVVKVESQADYLNTVPENVRLANEEKRNVLSAEIETLEQSKAMFEKLK
ncbi:valine-tRNA ligase [Coprinellus micaceus]|uniref:valine--tRNA ligase n=1 Tax=Coprinellus micaceus TaxID=71717 RepID=A0A4Y7TMP1_COPMI|nr:valine-tRNA ligase [Coprinellus micaceus]